MQNIVEELVKRRRRDEPGLITVYFRDHPHLDVDFMPVEEIARLILSLYPVELLELLSHEGYIETVFEHDLWCLFDTEERWRQIRQRVYVDLNTYRDIQKKLQFESLVSSQTSSCEANINQSNSQNKTYSVPLDDVVLQEAIQLSREPIKYFLPFDGMAMARCLAHMIVKYERFQDYRTITGAKYYLDHLSESVIKVSLNRNKLKYRDAFDSRVRRLARHLTALVGRFEYQNGAVDTSAMNRLVVLSDYSPEQFTTCQLFSRGLKITNADRDLYQFIDQYLWDQHND